MKTSLLVCVCAVLTLVASQDRGPRPPIVDTGRAPAIGNANVEPYRPVVAARPVEENEMSVIMTECLRRIAINASMAHYVQVPSDCGAFASCEFPDSGLQPAFTLCPAGLFFNDDMDVMACVRPVQSNCRDNNPGNPCVGKTDGFNQDPIRSQQTQGAYYVCRNGQTVSGGWCDLGEQYLKFDQACLTIPDLNRPTPPLRDPIPCHLQAIQGDSQAFLLGDSRIECAGNTQFNLALCGCE